MKKKKWAARALLIAGLLASACAIIALASQTNLLQYAIVAPTGEDADRQVVQLARAREEIAQTLADCADAVAVGGEVSETSVSAADANGTARMYCIGEGWFEIYPAFLVSGRRITETELASGAKVAMMDADLAFELYGSEEPENAKVTIGSAEYEVVGTIRHRRGVGDAAEHVLYVPLLAEPGRSMDTMLLSAVPIPNSGARTMFESTAESEWCSGGCFYSIEKEVMRRMMIARVLLLIFGMSGILALMRRMNALAARMIADFREGMRWYYFKHMFWKLLAIIAACTLGYAALLGLLYALMHFSIQAANMFTEWVPENVVELSSLRKVFWNLVGDAAATVKVGTREVRAVEFWGGMLRWGAISALCGALLLRFDRGKSAQN